MLLACWMEGLSAMESPGFGKLAVDGPQSRLGGLHIQFVLGFGLIQFGDPFRQALHLVVGGEDLMLHLVVLQLGLCVVQFLLGGFHPLFQKFPGGGRFCMGEFREPIQETLDQELIGLLGLFRALTGDVYFQDFRIFIGLGNDVSFHIIFVTGKLAVLLFFGLLDHRDHHMAALEDLRMGVHLLLGKLGIAQGQLFHDGTGKAFLLFDPQQGCGLIGIGDDEEIGHGQPQEAAGDLGDAFLVGADDLPQFP